MLSFVIIDYHDLFSDAVATTIGFHARHPVVGCDLLKKCYLCSSNNNILVVNVTIKVVVICSKNVTFAVATTIFRFLFKEIHSCDLLKKCYLCSSNNNKTRTSPSSRTVVICSKNVTFAVATTMGERLSACHASL